MKPTFHGIALLWAIGCSGEAADTDAGERGDSGRPSSARDGGRARDAATAADAASPLADAGPVDSGPPPDPCADRVFCDDFEDDAEGAAPAAPWAASLNGGTAEVRSARAFSGTRAVRFTTNGGSGSYRRAYIAISGEPVFPAVRELMYGRMMVWLAATPSGSVHWTNVEGEGPVPDMSFRALSRYGGQHAGRLMANYETRNVGSDCWQHSSTVMPTGRWTCVEWRFEGSTDRMDFWLDGAPLADLSVAGRGEGCVSNGTGGNWYGPRYETIRVGWEHYQATGPIEMWIDDVAIDDARIGCPP